jgi:formate hydrogenlyase transcriptional activator
LQEVPVKTLEGRKSRERQAPERRFEQIVGNSLALEAALGQVQRVAVTDSTVLVLGETGTGKELIARAIHNISPRCGRPFVKVNCAAIPLDLLESELFGHERGAFTGATTQRIGRFELADTGTLFLDEIGDLPISLQPKLLRVLQEQEFERLGSSTTRRVSVRLVTATHRDLSELVRQNRFRLDLFYRLHVVPIQLPALRERREDIAPLVKHFVELHSQRMGIPIAEILPDTMKAFKTYSWPGNIRELQNLVERAVIMSNDGVLANPLAPDASEVDGSSCIEPLGPGTVRFGSKRALSTGSTNRLGFTPQPASLKQQNPEVIPLRFRA